MKTAQQEVEVKRPKGWVFRKEVSKNAVIYAIETPPGKYPFAFKDTQGSDGWGDGEDDDAYEIQHLNVFFPRLLWFVSSMNKRLDKVRVFWIEAPFKRCKLLTNLYPAPVPNLDDSGYMCFGNFKPGHCSEVDLVNKFMEHAFNSVWTSDMEPFYEALQNNGIQNVMEWHELSRKRTTNPFWDPGQVCEVSIRGVISQQVERLGES